jgi:hypothetical protein
LRADRRVRRRLAHQDARTSTRTVGRSGATTSATSTRTSATSRRWTSSEPMYTRERRRRCCVSTCVTDGSGRSARIA